MSSQLNDIWEKALDLMRLELSQISFDTWIKSIITPISMDYSSITFRVPEEFYKNMIISRYLLLIKNTIKQITSKEYDLIFITSFDEIQEEVQENQEVKPLKSKNNQLNSKYTFDTYVVGENNRFAHAAALAVSESPGHAYNPLFLYSGVGLGKTHLMHAISHYITQQNPNLKILYVTAEKFTNELIMAIKNDKMKEFRALYRAIYVLLIDDIQFIVGKERTHEEFFHTFNTLYEANKQIVISSDKPPKDIQALEERLKSRFEWGLVADIQPPDFETRIAILLKKVQIEKLHVSQEVLSIIATKIASNIRELEGALNKIVAYSTLTNRALDVDFAEEILKDIVRELNNKKLTSELIIDVVSKYFDITPEQLKSSKRTKDIVLPRQVAMYLCREIASLSLPKIGDVFGGKNHTTVLHACDRISQNIKNSQEISTKIDDIKNIILQK